MKLTITNKYEPNIRNKCLRKPRMKINIRENRIGINNELNGYIIYCQNKNRVCESWWSSPGDTFGGVESLQDRGYRNIETNLDYRLFSMITRIALSNIRKDGKRFEFYNKTSNKYIRNFNPYGQNELSDKSLYLFGAKDALHAINNNHVDMRHWVVKEVLDERK